jgi:ABC-2 type transport system ATP-binding protein
VKRSLVKELSLTLERGEVFGFLGPNGAGKTTTIRMLCRLIRPSAGHGAVLGYDIWRDRFQVRSLLARLCATAVQPLSGSDCARESLVFRQRLPRAPAYGQLPDRNFTLAADLFAVRQKRAGQLSGGFKQLLAIGCALLHNPPLLLLDEPTFGLDPTHRQTIWDLLYRLSQEYYDLRDHSLHG